MANVRSIIVDTSQDFCPCFYFLSWFHLTEAVLPWKIRSSAEMKLDVRIKSQLGFCFFLWTRKKIGLMGEKTLGCN